MLFELIMKLVNNIYLATGSGFLAGIVWCAIASFCFGMLLLCFRVVRDVVNYLRK